MAERQRAVIWTPGARTDLDEIVAYIAKDSLPSARAFLEEAFETAETSRRYRNGDGWFLS